MMNVYVHEDPEHARENFLARLLEIFWELHVRVPGEDGLVEDLILDPVKKAVVVVGR